MLGAIADGETNREALAALADRGLRGHTVEAQRFDGAEPGFPAGGQFVNG